MNEEVLIEEGIVISVFGEYVEIILTENENCETCLTKDFCKGSAEKSIRLRNELNLKIGDHVKIEVRGKTILKTVFLLYVIPLLILLSSFLILYQLIETNKELLVSSISFSLVGMYFLLITFYLRKFGNQFKVKIAKLD